MTVTKASLSVLSASKGSSESLLFPLVPLMFLLGFVEKHKRNVREEWGRANEKSRMKVAYYI